MTDGCGVINSAAMRTIQDRMKFERQPTAIQARCAGSKGLWALAPRDDPCHKSPEPVLLVANSQRKIVLPEMHSADPASRAHRIFNLLAPNRVSSPARLNLQAVMNLSHNGIRDEQLVELLRTALEAEVAPLRQWTGRDAMTLLWKSVESAGRISGMRVRRAIAGQSRAHGFGQKFSKDEEDDEDLPEDPLGVDNCFDFDSRTSRNAFTGAPGTLAESILELLQAGYEPLTCPVLYDKLHTLIKLTIEGCIREYHISVPHSAEAYVIPGKSLYKISIPACFNLACRLDHGSSFR